VFAWIVQAPKQRGNGDCAKWFVASSKGPAEWFTGDVAIDPLFEAPEPARVRAASVTFEPGGAPHARSAIQA